MRASVKAIAHFESATALVGGVTLHYWLGGDPNGPPVLLWHGFLGTSYSWHKVMPLLVEAGYRVLVPDMRGFGDSDKPAGNEGYDGRALAEEFRALRQQIGFGAGRPLTLVAHDIGAPPALLWAADHPDEVAGLIYVEGPVMLQAMLGKIIAYTPEAMAKGSFWWWVLPLAPGVPEILIVGREREFLNWFYQGPSGAAPEAISPESVNEYLRSFSGKEGVLGAEGVYRAAFTTIAQTAHCRTAKSRCRCWQWAARGGSARRWVSSSRWSRVKSGARCFRVAATLFLKSAPTLWSTRCCGSLHCQDL
jgi:pimeloyl-ACP methyl ester carboxylesterase